MYRRYYFSYAGLKKQLARAQEKGDMKEESALCNAIGDRYFQLGKCDVHVQNKLWDQLGSSAKRLNNEVKFWYIHNVIFMYIYSVHL